MVSREHKDKELQELLAISKFNSKRLENQFLAKIDKYQSGKMSEKEVGKMINKVKDISSLAEVVSKFQSQQQLEPHDLENLVKAKQVDFYVVNYQDMALDEDLYVININFEKIFPLDEIQEDLSRIYEHQKEIERLERIQKNIPQEPKPLSQLDYLKQRYEEVKKGILLILVIG